MKTVIQKILPENRNITIYAMVYSVLLSIGGAIVYYLSNYDGQQVYTDLVHEYLAVDAAYKQVEYNTVYLFFGSLLICFIILCIVFQKMEYCKIELSGKILLCFGPILLCAGLGLDSAILVALIVYMLISLGLYAGRVLDKSELTAVTELFFLEYLFVCAVVGAGALADSVRGNALAERFLYIFVGLLVCNVFFSFSWLKTRYIKIMLSITQVFIPILLAGICTVQYVHRDAAVEVEYMGRFYKIVFVVMVALVIMAIYNIAAKKPKQSIYLSTYISALIMSRWNVFYNLVINSDPFHTGETEIVYNQVVNFQQGWNKDFISVLQGLGLITSSINEFVFGGNFATYMQAQNFWQCIVVVMTGVALWLLIDNKLLLLVLVPMLPYVLTNRCYLLIFTLAVLLSPKLIKSFYRWGIAYVALCIINVFYQPTYGGAICAGLAVIFVIFAVQSIKGKEFLNREDRGNFKKSLVYIGGMVCVLIACIPFLRGVAEFLVLNGAQTQNANGITILQSYKYFPEAKFFTGNETIDFIVMYYARYAAGIVAVLLILAVALLCYRNITSVIVKRQVLLIAIVSPLAFLMMLSASLNRVDAGLTRIGWVNCIFLIILLLLIYILWDQLKSSKFMWMVMGVTIMLCMYANGADSLLGIHQKEAVTVEIPKEAEYVTEEYSGLTRLGNVYTDDMDYIAEAMCLNEMCTYLLDDNQTYFDALHCSIFYNYTNRIVPSYHVCHHTISNTKLQKKSVETLQKYDVPLIFVKNLGVKKDFSEKDYRVYKYFMLQDYNYIVYKGCGFLVRSDIDLTPIKDDVNWELSTDKELNQVWHMGTMGKIGEEWGANFENMSTLFEPVCATTLSLSEVTVGKENGSIRCELTEKVDGETAEFALIKLNYEDKGERAIAVITEGIDEGGETFQETLYCTFDKGSGAVLVPIASSPICLKAQEITAIDLVFFADENNPDSEPYTVHCDGVEIYSLND